MAFWGDSSAADNKGEAPKIGGSNFNEGGSKIGHGADKKESVGSKTIFGSGNSMSEKLGSDQFEAFLGKGSKVVGTLTFSGPVELDGYIEGEVISQDRLTVGESAVINARITGAEVIVKGTVNGDISASKKLTLRRPARVVGNISTTSLSIEEGVIFEGKSSMAGGSSTATKVSDSSKGQIKPLSTEKIGASA